MSAAGIRRLPSVAANERVPLDELVVGGWDYDAAVSSSSVENHRRP